MKSSTIKTICYVCGVLGLIGCVLIGYQLMGNGNNTILGIFALTGILCMVSFFAIGNLLEDVEILAENSSEIKSLLKQMNSNRTGADNRTSNSPQATVRQAPAKPAYNLSNSTYSNADSWICPKCGEKNPRLSMNCKGCGKTR